MSEVQQPKDPKVIQHFIDTVNEDGMDLTALEINFMESITEQFEKYKKLSFKQVEILERIYANKTP